MPAYLHTCAFMVHAQYLCRNIYTQIYVHTFVLFSLLSLIFSFLAFTPTVVSHYQCTMTGKRRGLATHLTNKRPFADYPAILDMNHSKECQFYRANSFPLVWICYNDWIIAADLISYALSLKELFQNKPFLFFGGWLVCLFVWKGNIIYSKLSSL